jgi:hypothetical protein
LESVQPELSRLHIVSPAKIQKTKALLAIRYIGPTAKASVPKAFQESLDAFEKEAEVEVSLSLPCLMLLESRLTECAASQDHSSQDRVGPTMAMSNRHPAAPIANTNDPEAANPTTPTKTRATLKRSSQSVTTRTT